MSKNFAYVDNSNVYIEGSRYAAVQNQLPGAKTIAEAIENNVVHRSWNLDYGQLHAFVCGTLSQIGCANLWGSPPPHDSFWNMVKHHGFRVTLYERNVAGKEKKVDVGIAHQMTKDAYSGVIQREKDELTLVAGDKDFVPVVEDLVAGGFTVHIVFWSHATAHELKAIATKFVNLYPYFRYLSHAARPAA